MKRTILIIVLLFVSCQKDYYLDDLNDALSQVSSLQSENSSLKSQLQQLNSRIQQLDQLVSNLNNTNSSLQTELDNLNASYNQLSQAQESSILEIEELNNKIILLANQLRVEIAESNPILNGYYYTTGYSRIVNDSILWEGEIEKNVFMSSYAGIVKVEEGEITEDYNIRKASSYWENANDNDILKHRSYYPRNYTYKAKSGNYMNINEYTGDSLQYIDNYKVYDKDIFTWDLIKPGTDVNTDRIIYKNVSYRLFTNDFEIIDGVNYPPVVNISSNSDYNGINSFEEIKGVYDYESNTGFLSDSIYSLIDQSDPKSYLAAFIKDAERNGIDLSNVNPDLLETEPWFTPTDQYGRNDAAWGSITCSETYNRIGYDNGWFEGSFLTDKRWGKLYVMYHEFGHTVLGLKHTCAKNHIMTSGSSTGEYPCNGEVIDENEPLNTVDEFKRAVTDLFNGYNQFYFDCYLNSSNDIIDIE